MASVFQASRSVCTKKLLNRSVLKSLLLPRSAVALEKRSFSQCMRTVSHFRARVLGQTLPSLRFCSARAGIVESKYSVEIPEKSLSEFVMSNFQAHGDDIAVVSLYLLILPG